MGMNFLPVSVTTKAFVRGFSIRSPEAKNINESPVDCEHSPSPRGNMFDIWDGNVLVFKFQR